MLKKVFFCYCGYIAPECICSAQTVQQKRFFNEKTHKSFYLPQPKHYHSEDLLQARYLCTENNHICHQFEFTKGNITLKTSYIYVKCLYWRKQPINQVTFQMQPKGYPFSSRWQINSKEANIICSPNIDDDDSVRWNIFALYSSQLNDIQNGKQSSKYQLLRSNNITRKGKELR